MGNMSNPSINRWGLNLFWYKYWYNDKNYHLSVQHDNVMSRLLYTFLNFGMTFPVNIFTHKYWVKQNNKINYFNNHNTKYYRIMNFKNFITQEISHYNERIRIEHIYQSKIWILKFQHWVILNFYCFNPIKKRQKNKNIITRKRERDSFLFKTTDNVQKIKRLRFIFFYLFCTVNKNSLYYKF